MDERVVWSHLIQMCEGLQCLHDHQIVHRDLKSANIFLAEDGSVKIGDLNVSKRMKAGLLRTQIGTPYYMSPEVWLNKPYGPSSDVLSLTQSVHAYTRARKSGGNRTRDSAGSSSSLSLSLSRGETLARAPTRVGLLSRQSMASCDSKIVASHERSTADHIRGTR